jgi:hypothetical protein
MHGTVLQQEPKKLLKLHVSWRFGDQEEVHYKNRLFRPKEWRECITRQRNRDRASVLGMRDLNEKL